VVVAKTVELPCLVSLTVTVALSAVKLLNEIFLLLQEAVMPELLKVSFKSPLVRFEAVETFQLTEAYPK
jgi:hypothetical protein